MGAVHEFISDLHYIKDLIPLFKQYNRGLKVAKYGFESAVIKLADYYHADYYTRISGEKRGEYEWLTLLESKIELDSFELLEDMPFYSSINTVQPSDKLNLLVGFEHFITLNYPELLFRTDMTYTQEAGYSPTLVVITVNYTKEYTRIVLNRYIDRALGAKKLKVLDQLCASLISYLSPLARVEQALEQYKKTLTV